MDRWRLVLVLVVALVSAGAIIVTVREWAGAGSAEVRAVPPGSQEIAWIAPATSGDSWERLVAALTLLQHDDNSDTRDPTLRINLDNAFLPLTADVPEVALSWTGNPDAKLYIRWYKLSGENPSRRWFDKLIQRGRPPLAVIGGDTSDHALYQASALRDVRERWSGPPPVYFLTTATAERYDPRAYQAGEVPHVDWPKLMEVYNRRSFRFCFTNTRMVEAVLDFVHQNPQVCAQRLTDPPIGAAVIAQGSALGSLAVLSAAGHLQPYYTSTLIWKDDGYSKDLGEIFLQVFAEQARPNSGPFKDFYNNYVDYSVGDFLEPNPSEALQVGLFLDANSTFRDKPQLLALPTGAQRARRFLRTLCRRAPREIRNVVVVTGDGIAFNNIYRDHDVTWNIQDMPVPLVFFSHRNPVDKAAGFGKKEDAGFVNNTGTQDVLLNRDIAEALLLAARAGGRLVADADEFLERLNHTGWRKGRIRNDLGHADTPAAVPFFDAAGNRRPDTGEHIVWLRPIFDGNRNLPEAELTIWRAGGDRPDRTWRTFGRALPIRYDRPTPEDSSAHGGD
jgi:hypothetical protein